MNRIRTIAPLVILALLVIAGAAYAQQVTKVAIINSQKAFETSAEGKKAFAELQKKYLKEGVIPACGVVRDGQQFVAVPPYSDLPAGMCRSAWDHMLESVRFVDGGSVMAWPPPPSIRPHPRGRRYAKIEEQGG